MFLGLFFITFTVAECANYQRYGESTTYPGYSTIANLYNQFPYKTGSNVNDIARFPEATRYPNYSPGYSTTGYNSYTTLKSNVFYPPGYTTPRYGEAYDQGYGRNYGQQGYSGYSSYEMPFMRNIRDYCVNRSPQMGIWLESMMGMWFGVEVIQHLTGDSRVEFSRSCIVIHISEPTERPSTENQLFHVQHINAKFRQEFRHLRLLWDEAGHTIEYSLYFRNDSAGYWQVFDGQNGTVPMRSNYQQFSGTVQVLKAVNDHLVLNFCQEASNNRPAQLFSVLLSREPGYMAQWEVQSVHGLLQNKKLSIASRRKVCGNSADRPLFSIVFSIILCALTYTVAS